MAARRNLSRDVSSNRAHHSAGTSSHPPLPPLPANGNNVRPVPLPLWEREFCRSAYKFPWKTFCENKRFIESFYKNVMEWDDSGALKSFMDAKERFRAKYHGEPYYQDPGVLDPDMYVDDEIDHHCKVDPELIEGLDDLAAGGLDDLVTTEVCWWGGNGDLVVPEGWGDSDDNVTPPHCTVENTNNNNFYEGVPSSNQQQQQQQGVVYPGQRPSGTGMNLMGGRGRALNSGSRRGGAMRWSGGGGGRGNGVARHWNGGGGNWNGGGRGNQRNQDEAQHQQRGGMQRGTGTRNRMRCSTR